jgi:hypothetical protein
MLLGPAPLSMLLDSAPLSMLLVPAPLSMLLGPAPSCRLLGGRIQARYAALLHWWRVAPLAGGGRSPSAQLSALSSAAVAAAAAVAAGGRAGSWSAAGRGGAGGLLRRLAGALAGVVRGAAAGVALALFWPVHVLATAMAHDELFWPLLWYAALLMVGPWMVAGLSSHSWAVGVMTAWGVVASLPDGGGWAFHANDDCTLIAALFTCLVVCPVVAWVAWVVCRWDWLRKEGRRGAGVSLAQAALLLPVVLLWSRVASRMLHAYGLVGLVLSPAMAHLPLFVAWLLHRVRARSRSGRAD